MKRKPRRIYYGPEGHETSLFWSVRVSEATQPVTINGSILHALKGYSGMTVGCGLSNMAVDKENAKAFPHPVFLASFTKTTAMIVDKLKPDGSPAHAVLYKHSYEHITDNNDSGTLKEMVLEDPSIIERSFTLRVPRKRGKTLHGQAKKNPDTGSKRNFVPRGALARAVKAGRIGKHVAKQLESAFE